MTDKVVKIQIIKYWLGDWRKYKIKIGRKEKGVEIVVIHMEPGKRKEKKPLWLNLMQNFEKK